MKVLLTGASGLVGSHILDRLRAREVPVVLLLRPASNPRFIQPHLSSVEVRRGSVTEPAGLAGALEGVTHVIHCAGATKAQPVSDFYTINQQGTRNLVEAVNAAQGRVKRLVHISSLAATGPGTTAKPAREEDLPGPVSEYGRSKLAGEQEVRDRCRAEHVILRPPAVYGPRDAEFLRLFRAVKAHLLPSPTGRQPLSLVYVQDLAEVAVACLELPQAANRTYFVSSPEVVTARQMAQEVAAALGTWTLPLPVPLALLWLVCVLAEAKSRLTGQANVMSLQKYPELRAAGWVCEPARLKKELDLQCATDLKAGIGQTLAWCRREGWL